MNLSMLQLQQYMEKKAADIKGEKTHMSKYIYAVLCTQPTTVFSWGAHDFESKGEDSLVFKVKGFLYKGDVEIKYIHGVDLFEVILSDKKIEDVYVDQLVDVIDRNVEFDGDVKSYMERVQAEYEVNICQE